MVNGHSPIVSKTLFDLFRRLSSHSFLFIEPGGNSGDSLIYKGAYKLAARAQLQYEAVRHEEIIDRLNEVPSDKVVYIHGSGGFVPLWSGRPSIALRRLVATFNGTIILGPSTFSEDVDYLKESLINFISDGRCRKVFIFAREHTSYLVLKQWLPSWVELLEDHDTALNLQAQDFDITRLEQIYALYAIRADKERSPKQKMDIFSSRLDPVLCCRSFEEWFLLHARAKEIVTNRLHSSILGSILGKRTTLLPNSYHKNRSLWEFSLKSRGVLWREALPVNPLNEWLSNQSLIRRLRFSCFAERLIKSYFLELC
ncbi:MAG: hypothetical protein CVU64_16890 [Deltaproteobacteria bacterium HGW-Deltaproteobacteria-21]|nr:MAG: hypothetical protein CVU64_16890 [Deltaproteobacteria bacterium HGW-Deltaproteobacteria-21]